jgi:hypothetical protein
VARLAACAAEPGNEDRTDGPETLEPSNTTPKSKHPMPNAYQPGAKREKLENSSKYSTQIHPTDHQQDITLSDPSTTSLDEISHSGEQTSNGTQGSSSSISHAYKGLLNGIALSRESFWADRMIYEPQDCTEIKSVRILEMLALLRLNRAYNKPYSF